jgi:uncharacterized protein YndB with AHSA1/START domain
MIDVQHQISAVERRVGTRTLAAGEARVVTISQRHSSPIEDVWDACTDPERIPRWFLPVSGELRLGGRYRLEGNAEGTVERCDPPRSFAATWEYGGEVSWIEVALTADGDRTRFELQHIAHVADERWTEFGPGAVGVGWDLGLTGLAEHLSTGAAVTDPERVQAWLASAEGVRFLTESSQACPPRRSPMGPTRPRPGPRRSAPPRSTPGPRSPSVQARTIIPAPR